MLAAGAVACMTKDEDFDRLVATRARGCGGDEADRREHRGRPRLDRRLPGGAGALPELARRAALRALRRRELPRLRRHRARTSSTSGSPTAPELPTTSQPTPGDFLGRLRGARAAVRADPLAADLLDALRHVRERAAGRGAARRRPGARDRHAHRLGGARDARDRRAAAARARHDRRGDRRARRALPPTSTSCSSRSTRSSTSRRAAASAARRRSPAAC